MSKRVLISSLIGVLALGGVAAGGIAIASSTAEPTLEKTSARYVAPTGDKAGSLTFTTDVRDNSGVLDLKVIAWPASSKLDPTETELELVENAECVSTSDETSRCTYTLTVTKADAAELARGTWYVSALATAKDGDRTFVPRAATFDIAG
ncbi:hypothetical protein Sipo8835_25505 [Streptomyces ipomoeae]|jgi:hypothetical protein|uniref:Tat pathway signal sequence domain protein n=2 Tax=Streptomyces ipomoeae TaxID=103232 RepID=L1KR90_9ACTN|nr:DUF5707 domain-containing protein [Streptomyces ipomoeae]EKX63281.1 hypothetical protein STRIP9103_05098 [Streptomyces ipomoeae 91-03]MDX2700086.1 DUF5707 domain-containing protein [Streptomyces ipomoeae]MDX2827691.1 DUF5707 domain-containing protein [Streptomyces ipomoeae]MDX2842413.1 DUF5707 domain-containing protein [Streptomyces ipomoeae]MDX2876837.1 DUF5707 domain-containing protein [Streptomyces ipomoeae]